MGKRIKTKDNSGAVSDYGYIDFHCHPSMKPYGKSFNEYPIGGQNPDPNNKTSGWFYDSPNLFEKGIQSLAGISKFTQSDFTTLAYGNVRIICASLYPLERGFFRNKVGKGAASDLINNFITGVGRARVNYIQGITNYFEDLEREYDFYKQLHDQTVHLQSGSYKYVLVNNYKQIETEIAKSPEGTVIFVIMSIEGLHVLDENMDSVALDEKRVLANLIKIKNWEYPPLFVTFSHHFNNRLCGHAKSLTDLVGKATDQSQGLDDGFSAVGLKVLKETLSTKNGKRIYIDIKHMSAQGRMEYYQILQNEYAGGNIPVVVSHGAANGLRSMDEPVVDLPDTGTRLLSDDINFYDNEIEWVARSGGIFGIQLDERRIASRKAVKAVKHSLFINKIRHYRAELLWNQVQHIAELLDGRGLPAWDCMALGTDFEGIINPLNGYLTSETLVHLEEYLERYAFNYMSDQGKRLQKRNQLAADKIVHKIFHLNGREFLKRVFV